jgi:restriction endonuclease S subunit
LQRRNYAMKNTIPLPYLLTDLNTGYSFRTRIEHNPDGDIAVIQMKDTKNNFTRIGSDLFRISDSSISPRYFLHKGDVLFLSKGSNNKAFVFDMDLQQVVAAAAFFVLRPDKSQILPEYLAWYLNQQPVQKYILENRAGTYMPNVNKKTLLGIQIQLPDLKTQEKIAMIDNLRMKELLLTKELLNKREMLITNQLLEKIK